MREIRQLLFVPLFVCAAPLVGAWGFSPKVSITANVAPRYYLGSSVKKVLLVDKSGKGIQGKIIASTTELGYCREIGASFLYSLKRISKSMIAEGIQTPAGLADFEQSGPGPKDMRGRYPADAYAGLSDCGCDLAQKGTRQAKDLRYEGTCQGRLRLIDGKDGHEIIAFIVRGATTTQTNDRREEAELEATEKAPREAVLMIAPSTEDITIELEKNVPAEKEALSAVKQKNYTAARAIWENALGTNASSAALNFNLGAVSEASGDPEAARKYYREAVQLAPTESKYKDTFMEFYKRASDADLLARGVPR